MRDALPFAEAAAEVVAQLTVLERIEWSCPESAMPLGVLGALRKSNTLRGLSLDFSTFHRVAHSCE